MSTKQARAELERLIGLIDFATERFYNLYLPPEGDPSLAMPAEEAWASVSSLTSDLAKFRGELARMRRGVEELRMPAIEAIGLDRVVEQLRGLELKLKPVGEALSKRPEEEGTIKRLLKDVLTVADALDRVFELVEAQPGAIPEGVEKGLRSVYRLMIDTLKRYGLEPVQLEQFDPHVHMAMGTEPNPSLSDGAISRVLLKGYLLGGQILRTAQVVIAKNK